MLTQAFVLDHDFFYCCYLSNALAALDTFWNQFVCEWVSEVRVCHKKIITSWTLYRSQSSADFHQTWHQGRRAGNVVNYCFWWERSKRGCHFALKVTAVKWCDVDEYWIICQHLFRMHNKQQLLRTTRNSLTIRICKWDDIYFHIMTFSDISLLRSPMLCCNVWHAELGKMLHNFPPHWQ